MPEQGPDRGLQERELPKIVFVRRIEDIQFRFRELGVPDMQSMGPIISAAVNCYAVETPANPNYTIGSSQCAQLSDGSMFKVTRKLGRDGLSMYIIEKFTHQALT